jgi:hypothetical protein
VALVLGALVFVLALGIIGWLQSRGGGTGLQGFNLGDQRVYIFNGYRADEVTWVGVVNFPRGRNARQERNDTRVSLGPRGEDLIRRPDGTLLPPASEPRLYFFDGDELTTFPIEMHEGDWLCIRKPEVGSYGEILERFRRFEKKPRTG